jgi:hypothetical protein
MRPIKVGITSNSINSVKTEVVSPVNINDSRAAEPYIDYTNFKDGNIMRYDDVKNCFYFSEPDEVLNDTLKQETTPEVFINTLLDTIEPTINIDSGEY